MAQELAIQVSHVQKTFKLPHERQSSLKSSLINFNKRGFEKQRVLKDISFEVKKGEFFGIVGRNGSGKSTLLKLLAGIYTPNNGSVQVNGKLTPFIELGVGFNPELTGRENVFLNGALLGFSRKEMEKLYDDIVSFAELDRFMDQKLKNYSSGMQVRLAFSIAIRAKSDILLIDEVLAVGDANFQKKCYQYFYELKRSGQTVVLVTHDMGAVKNFCDRAILINDGDLIANGSAAKVAQKYSLLNMTASEKGDKASPSWGSGEMVIDNCLPLTPAGQTYYKPTDKIEIKLEISVHKEVSNPIIGVTIKDLAGREIFVTNTKALSIKTGTFHAGEKHDVVFEIDNVFNDGTYTVSPAIANQDITAFYSGIDDVCRFEVLGWAFPTGIVQAPTAMTLKKRDK
jgi:ABC-2 type transport system ATP-binding protein